jgi:Xaa-Pro aminopeptidase
MKSCLVSRIEFIQKNLAEENLDAAIVCAEPSLMALTGYSCDNGCLLVDRKNAIFFTDFRYKPEVKRLVPWMKTGDIAKILGKKPFSKILRYKKIGLEFSMPHSMFLSFAKSFPGAEFSDISPILSMIRSVKNKNEIDAIKKAAALNDKIWSYAKKSYKPGMTEKEFARKIKVAMISRGYDEAFSTIVACGKNAAECHHIPDDTVMNERDNILVDMGVKYCGYCSDMTRNIVSSKPSSKYKEIYNRVLEANMAAIDAVEPGMACCELDGIARKYLAKHSLDKYFKHSLGHGVGIEVHEFPTVSKKSDAILLPGMFVTIEPGVYIEGELGVRIEDFILITEDGCEVVSKSPKKLEV